MVMELKKTLVISRIYSISRISVLMYDGLLAVRIDTSLLGKNQMKDPKNCKKILTESINYSVQYV